MSSFSITTRHLIVLLDTDCHSPFAHSCCVLVRQPPLVQHRWWWQWCRIGCVRCHVNTCESESEFVELIVVDIIDTNICCNLISNIDQLSQQHQTYQCRLTSLAPWRCILAPVSQCDVSDGICAMFTNTINTPESDRRRQTRVMVRQW